MCEGPERHPNIEKSQGQSNEGYMSAQEALVRDYLRNLWLIQVLMTIVLVTIIFWPLFFPLTEEQQEGMGAGGAIMCFVFWMGLIVVFSALCIWMVVKRSRNAATSVSLAAWLLPLGIFTLGSSLLYVALSSIAPFIMSALAVQLERIARQIWPYVMPVPPEEPTVLPRLRLYR